MLFYDSMLKETNFFKLKKHRVSESEIYGTVLFSKSNSGFEDAENAVRSPTDCVEKKEN